MVKLRRLCFLMAALVLILTGCAQTPSADENQQLIDEIRPVVDAFLNGGPAERAALVAFVNTACTTAEGLGGPPKCEGDETEGTEVTAFPVSGGEGTFNRPGNIERAFEFSVQGLYAVYRAPPTIDPAEYWPRGEYALLFDRTVNEFPSPIIALVEGGRIVRLGYQFGMGAEEYFSSIAADQVLLTPAEAQALSREILGG